MSTAYADLMRTRMDEVRDPEPLDSGEWEFRCTSAKSKENADYDPEDEKNGYVAIVNIATVPVQPIGHTPDGDDWRGQTIFKRIFVKSNGDLVDLRRMAEAMGIAVEGREFEEQLALMKNRRFVASVGLRTYQRRDGTTGKENTLSGYRPTA